MSRVLFAAEALLPARPGPERFAVELLGALAARGHEVRAVWLGPLGGPAGDGLPTGVTGRVARAPVAGAHWANRAARRAALGEALAAEEPADVVVATGGACSPPTPSVLLLRGPEALCRYAFEPGSGCASYRDCVRCPRARSLPDAEAARLRTVRAEDDAALAAAAAIVAPSRFVAGTVERWCGRRAEVVPPVCAAAAEVRGRPGGHVLVAAETWPADAAGLLAPLAGALGEREVVVMPHGLDDDARRAVGAAGNVWFMEAPLARLLDGAAVCVMPSPWPEPFARIAFEAQASRVPVLAAAAGALAEVVPESALLAPGAPAEDWAAAVAALSDPDAWSRARHDAHQAATDLLGARPLERVVEIVERAAAA